MKTLRKNDPKEYWKILNTAKSTKPTDIEFKELFNFFRDLNTLKETNEKFSYALTFPYGVFSDCCLKFFL
jgi:hypothetical protein